MAELWSTLGWGLEKLKVSGSFFKKVEVWSVSREKDAIGITINERSD
jgi:hypothetical protein